ncbi:hypothetical protein ACME9S_26520 [Klebsiella pneumoniae]
MARLPVITGFVRPPVSQMVFPGVKRAEDEEVVCESLVMSALRRNVEV